MCVETNKNIRFLFLFSSSSSQRIFSQRFFFFLSKCFCHFHEMENANESWSLTHWWRCFRLEWDVFAWYARLCIHNACSRQSFLLSRKPFVYFYFPKEHFLPVYATHPLSALGLNEKRSNDGNIRLKNSVKDNCLSKEASICITCPGKTESNRLHMQEHKKHHRSRFIG